MRITRWRSRILAVAVRIEFKSTDTEFYAPTALFADEIQNETLNQFGSIPLSPKGDQNERMVKCPAATRRRPGLDEQASWFITSELNHFIWPGFDVRPTPDNRSSYRLLPNTLTRRVIDQIKRNSRDQTLSSVNRDN
jgi:hypothetical protein